MLLTAAGIIFTFVWIGAAIYLWVVLGDRGVYADEHHTGGDILPHEWCTMAIALISLMFAFVCLFAASRRTRQ